MTTEPSQADFFALIATILRVLKKRKYLLILFTLAAAIGGTVLAVVSAPIYRSSALVALAREAGSSAVLSPDLAGVANLVGLGSGSTTVAEEAVAMLSSRRLTLEFFSQNNVVPKLYRHLWDAESNSWRDAEDAPTQLEAYDYFDTKVRSVFRDLRSDLITVTVDWRDPVDAANWANELVRLANRMQRESAIKDATNQLAYLDEQLSRTNELASRTVLYSLVEERMARIAVANTREEFAFRVIDPAVPPDSDRPIKPRAALLITTCSFLGFFLGLFAVFLLEIRERLH